MDVVQDATTRQPPGARITSGSSRERAPPPVVPLLRSLARETHSRPSFSHKGLICAPTGIAGKSRGARAASVASVRAYDQRRVMRARIHRGAREIGGSCVEIEHDGQRIVLDVGLPLDRDPDEPLSLPPVAGLAVGAAPDGLLAVFVSHTHPDHVGMLPAIAPGLPVYGGEAAGRVARAADPFMPSAPFVRDWLPMRDRQPVAVGPFLVTPLLVDHSAFDAYALLVEAGGQRLLYSGDLRAHGRKPSTWRRLLDHPPTGVNALLLEGTRLSRPAGLGGQ